MHNDIKKYELWLKKTDFEYYLLDCPFFLTDVVNYVLQSNVQLLFFISLEAQTLKVAWQLMLNYRDPPFVVVLSGRLCVHV